jgi:hypothetical protein
MAIYKLLRETAFDAETAEAMGQAYEALLLAGSAWPAKSNRRCVA